MYYNQFGKKKTMRSAMYERIVFKKQKSKSSPYVKDITGFLFGGTSSRFWMLRKHICSCKYSNEAISGATQKIDLPFYCWECLTIQTNNLDIDLVIQDQNNMNVLLTFLLYELQSVNGLRSSAIPLYDNIFSEQQKTQRNKAIIAKL
jgi:hypothetical protein